jgi:hypothetical protein
MSYFQVIPNGEAAKPSFELLKPHLKGGQELIPLKPLSWEPIDFDWPSAPPLSADQARAHMAAGGNIGVRLRPNMLVISVNLRESYEGKSPIQHLGDSLGGPLARGPVVLSGEDSQYFYFRSPPTAKSNEAFGVDGLRFGRR